MTTLPLDFDIFLRSGSRIHPDSATSDHGTWSNSSWLRSTVENSQVRMMSWPWGRRSIGNVTSNSAGSSPQRHAISGVSDEVAQVSMTSGSPTNPPGTPRWSSVKPGGHSACGSTGSADSSGRIGWSWSTAPSSSTGYQTGNGTPK